MPEEPEVELDKLRETIDEEMDRGGGSLLRWISLTTALLAAFAAVASLRAGATVNEALLLKTEATQLQAEASDAWAYYQAKGIKAAVARADVDEWRAAGKAVPDAVATAVASHMAGQDSLRHSAEAKERERDTLNREAGQLLAQHERFAYAVAFFQLAIALGAASMPVASKPRWAAIRTCSPVPHPASRTRPSMAPASASRKSSSASSPK